MWLYPDNYISLQNFPLTLKFFKPDTYNLSLSLFASVSICVSLSLSVSLCLCLSLCLSHSQLHCLWTDSEIKRAQTKCVSICSFFCLVFFAWRWARPRGQYSYETWATMGHRQEADWNDRRCDPLCIMRIVSDWSVIMRNVSDWSVIMRIVSDWSVSKTLKGEEGVVSKSIRFVKCQQNVAEASQSPFKKKKKAQAGKEWLTILSKLAQARKKPPPPCQRSAAGA